MRIGIDASRAFADEPTGTERYAFEIIIRMFQLPEAREHEWILYVKSNFQFSMTNFQSIFNIKYLKLKIIPIGLPYLWTQAGLAFRTWVDKLDRLWVPAHTLPVLRKPGLKTVVTIHGIEYEWLPAYENKLQRWYLPWSTIYAVNQANTVIAVSEFTKSQLIARLNADPNKIKVVLEGYETNFQYSITNFKSKSSDTIFQKYKLRSKEYILFIGTIQPRKNLERLIEAYSKLQIKNDKSQKNHLKLVIAGKMGWSYEGVLAAPEKFGVQDKVIFTGYIDDYTRKELLHQALVYVQPSITEGFGLPVLEAMDALVPVVSSNGGALAEVVGEAGVLFDPEDTEEIGHKLTLVISSHSLQYELIRKGRERIRDFSWDMAARETLGIISSNL